jgi:hypothetical protein
MPRRRVCHSDEPMTRISQRSDEHSRSKERKKNDGGHTVVKQRKVDEDSPLLDSTKIKV